MLCHSMARRYFPGHDHVTLPERLGTSHINPCGLMCLNYATLWTQFNQKPANNKYRLSMFKPRYEWRSYAMLQLGLVSRD